MKFYIESIICDFRNDSSHWTKISWNLEGQDSYIRNLLYIKPCPTKVFLFLLYNFSRFINLNIKLVWVRISVFVDNIDLYSICAHIFFRRWNNIDIIDCWKFYERRQCFQPHFVSFYFPIVPFFVSDQWKDYHLRFWCGDLISFWNLLC